MGDVHEGRWDGSPGRFTLEEWHRSCLLHLHGPGMPETKGQCKLPVRDPDGHVNRHGVHAAAARLNQVDAPPDKIARARAALRAAYKECGEDAPVVAKALPRSQKCKYCDREATKRIIHAEGMAYIPVCDAHLAKGKRDAEKATPDGSRDPSNIVGIKDIAKAGGDRPFRHENVTKERRVRTAAGARYFGLPIGAIITPDVELRAKARAQARSRGGNKGGGGKPTYGYTTTATKPAPAKPAQKPSASPPKAQAKTAPSRPSGAPKDLEADKQARQLAAPGGLLNAKRNTEVSIPAIGRLRKALVKRGVVANEADAHYVNFGIANNWGDHGYKNPLYQTSFQRVFGLDNAHTAHIEDFEGAKKEQNAGGTMDIVLEETYKETQRRLKELGVTHVRLFRGEKYPRSQVDGAGAPGQWESGEIKQQPAASWTLAPDIADKFSKPEGDYVGVFYAVSVPVADIFSIPMLTGFANDDEAEVVVLGRPRKVWRYVKDDAVSKGKGAKAERWQMKALFGWKPTDDAPWDEDEEIEKRRGRSGIRRVRTPEGARYFDAPIGTPITAAMSVAAKQRNRGRGAPRGEDRSGPPTRSGASGPGRSAGGHDFNMRGAAARPPRQTVRGGHGQVPPGASKLPEDRAERAKVYRQAVKEAQTETHLDLILARLHGDNMGTKVKADVEAKVEARRAEMRAKQPEAKEPEKERQPPPPPPPSEKEPVRTSTDPDEIAAEYRERIGAVRGPKAQEDLAQIKAEISRDKVLPEKDKKDLLARVARRSKQAETPPKPGDKVQVRAKPGAKATEAEVLDNNGQGRVKVKVPGLGERYERTAHVDVAEPMANASKATKAYRDRVLNAESYGDIERALNSIMRDQRVDMADKVTLRDLAQRREGDFAFVGEMDMQLQMGDADTDALIKRIGERNWLVDKDRADLVARIEAEAEKTKVVRKYVAMAREAKDEKAIQKIAVSAMSDKNLSKRQQNQLAVVLEDQLAFLDGVALDPALRKRIMQRKGDIGDQSRRWEDDPDGSPAAKELASGKTIDQVENPEGLLDYVLAHPEKFQVQVIDKGQQSSAWTVTERATGTKHFFKQATNNNSGHMYGDGINEYMAAQIGRAVFDDIFLDVDFVAPPEDGKNPVVKMTHAEEWAKQRGGTDVHFDARGRDPEVDKVADPKQPLAIHIFDFLINQQDRHSENLGWMRTSDGVVLIPVDNGGSFYGHKAVAENEPVEGIEYIDWVRRHPKGRTIRYEANMAYKAHGLDDARLIDDAEDIIERFQGVDIDKILSDLLKRFPNMDEYEREHAEAAVMVFRQRLELIDGDSVAALVRGTL